MNRQKRKSVTFNKPTKSSLARSSAISSDDSIKPKKVVKKRVKKTGNYAKPTKSSMYRNSSSSSESSSDYSSSD